MKADGKQPDISRRLRELALKMGRPGNHLSRLTAREKRLERFCVSGGGVFYDFSRQRLDEDVMALLFERAESLGVRRRFDAMVRGEKVNTTEDRPALHTAFRRFSPSRSGAPSPADGRDAGPEIEALKDSVRAFARDVHERRIKGSSGKPFKDIALVGIGGSHLGPRFVAGALEAFSETGTRLHFLSNVDAYGFEKTVRDMDPESALWVVASKSFTSVETLANHRLARSFMSDRVPDARRHFVAVTAAAERAGPDDFFRVFPIPDFVGGRYSVTSPAGGVPLSLFLGGEIFERFLKGAGEMDIHAASAPAPENAPLLAALVSTWNEAFLKYGALGIIPYADPLSGICAHVRQLHMESVGKAPAENSPGTGGPAGTVVFGEPGTNAQHSFFQMAHQGRPFPLEFIGIRKPWALKFPASYRGVAAHQELWANMIAQSLALAAGRKGEGPAAFFPGGRPSSIIVIDSLSPENIGRLLSFYEAKTVFEGFLRNVNPFDQFGVELGKKTASGIREKIRRRNETPGPANGPGATGDAEDFYIDMLFQTDPFEKGPFSGAGEEEGA
ncbi:Glucose-6-phosphate isomerase [Candidatus Desulfarcum epimagneticum]|uniref:Glucose-6-phosphate isomerase n=1 Tax=uncultured Desulfobacteraceae bacterium TaxID=218296 RepID=A0A484HGN6_9BACT|nr:Glucose-6-phosphate isomerase [uncultured Desulfobacteraceae bacterium]